VGDRRHHASDTSHLGGEVARHGVHVVGQVFPDTAYAFDLGLAAELAFSANIARHARDLVGERVELVDHDVDGVLELQDLALDVDGDLLREVTLLDRGGDLRAEERLVGKVRGHRVHAAGQGVHD